MKKLKAFYTRVKKNKVRHLILKITLAITYVGVIGKVLNFISRKPKPDYSDLPPSIIYDIFNKYYLIIGIVGILIVYLLDFISIRYKDSKSE